MCWGVAERGPHTYILDVQFVQFASLAVRSHMANKDERAHHAKAGFESDGAAPTSSDQERHAGRRRVLLVTTSSDVKQKVLLLLRELDRVKLLGATRKIEELHLWIDALQPDVVLLHVTPTESEVRRLLATIAALPSRPAVVVLIDETSDAVERRYLKGGARACLSMADPDFDGLPEVLAAL